MGPPQLTKPQLTLTEVGLALREMVGVDVSGALATALAPGGGKADLPAARLRALAKLGDDELEAPTRMSVVGRLEPSSRYTYASGIFSLASF